MILQLDLILADEHIAAHSNINKEKVLILEERQKHLFFFYFSLLFFTLELNFELHCNEARAINYDVMS